MAKFKVVTHKLTGASFGVSGEGYKLEMEALAPIDERSSKFPPPQRMTSFALHAMPMRLLPKACASASILSIAWPSARSLH